MRLTKLSTPKLRDTAKFRVNPDEAIRDYRLEKDVKASRQALTPSLWLNISALSVKKELRTLSFVRTSILPLMAL